MDNIRTSSDVMTSDMYKLYQGDCLELLKNLSDNSIDLVLCDLPYGTTQCKWDSCIPLNELWAEYKRVTKPNAAILLFGQQPFSSALVMSNPEMFRYEWVWIKNRATGFLNSKKMPLKAHENVLVFYKKLPTYNGQRRNVDLGGHQFPRITQRHNNPVLCANGIYGKHETRPKNATDTTRMTIDAVRFDMSDKERGLHPTQKPVALLEYLIKTYSNEGSLVLDNCMGSGSTGVACANLKRRFIGMELHPKYFALASNRIAEAYTVNH